ncbi:uncharacterized protein B0I36DRAFT_352867 [Microdochium trichocladiopsis]|uniref:Gpi anchored protein n=1 Tax=Microdochium trichocladiopsis TaxID=1682393 RepID=A0A9P9BPK7_9PEZI|nr:uncharacterized protein B0I36DRAFT_352867 [Microdochium trichocladiopsis]KAH7024656.1 hypothetical protein B0I36DRAFT_352867 [Microdochium trichocladiopsis]
MHFNNLAILFSLAAAGAAETTVDADDVPLACRNICRDTIDLSRRCEIQADTDTSTTDDDIIYNNCFCQAPDAEARISECATCVKANGMSDANDDDNEANGFIRSPANPVPTPTTNSGSGIGGIPTSVTMVPTTISTGGTTAVISTPSLVGNTQLPTTSVPGAAAMATPMVQGLVVAGLAAALF